MTSKVFQRGYIFALEFSRTTLFRDPKRATLDGHFAFRNNIALFEPEYVSLDTNDLAALNANDEFVQRRSSSPTRRQFVRFRRTLCMLLNVQTNGPELMPSSPGPVPISSWQGLHVRQENVECTRHRSESVIGQNFESYRTI